MTGIAARIRAAGPEDAAALGRVHVRAWQAAYRGVMPDEFLDGLDPLERGRLWAGRLAEPQPGISTLVLSAESPPPVGFAIVGPARDTGTTPPEVGELYAINLEPDVWGHGFGRELLAAATTELSRLGFREAILWCATGNGRARRFYEAAGWSADGTQRSDDSFGPQIEEIRYRRSVRNHPS